MKIYAFTDLHGNPKALAKIKQQVKKMKPDLVICAGDLTIFEHDMETLLKEMNKLSAPVIMLHGNHEEEATIRAMCEPLKNVTFLHLEVAQINGWNILAYGGGGFQEKYLDFEELSQQKEIKNLDWKRTILVTHAPPYGTKLDNVSDLGEEAWHVGSTSFTKLVKKYQPPLFITGHIHECFNQEDKIGKTLTVNPGPFGKLFEVKE